MLLDKTNFGLELYNHANFYQFEETSTAFIGQPATHLRHHSV